MATADKDALAAIERAEAIGASDAVEPLPPLPVKEVPALAATVTDLTSLRTAVVDAAGVSAGLWLSYLFVLFYLLVAAGAVTHKDLFFESPVKLPFLGIDLPLKGFFVLGPGLFLIVHTYILLHFSLLAGKVQTFNRELWKQIGDFETRSGLRRQLPANIFVQLLAGPSSDRNGVVGGFLWLIATISLVAGPVCLLLFFELQFLPYHDKAISNWHRIAVGLDLVLMWSFWWRVALRSGGPPDGRRLWDRAAIVIQYILTATVMLGLTGCSAVLMVAIATFDGEDIDIWALRHTWRSAPGPILRLREALVSGDVNPATRAPESLWSNRLVLPGLDVVVHLKLDSEAKIDFLPETVSLRARNLDGAVLIDAMLRKVDLTGASLRGALLTRANLQKAKLKCDYWLDPEKRRKEGKSDKPLCAQLQGATLTFAQLQGASLNGAQLQGASLVGAQLQGASLVGAQFQGASLNRAQLQGASLVGAQLQGASLDFAQLQGASLDFAQLQGASLRGAFVWRADLRTAETSVAWIDSVHSDPTLSCNESSNNGICPWTETTLRDLKEKIGPVVPEGHYREAALTRLAPRLRPPPAAPEPEEAAIDAWWNKTDTRQRPTRADFEAEAAKHWQQVGCQPDGAPHIVTQLASRLTAQSVSPHFDDHSPHRAALAAAFLAKDCAGAVGLSDALRARLQRLIPPKPPAP